MNIKLENCVITNKLKQNDEEKLYSQFRSILNKLSDSNFDALAKELISQEINKPEHLIKLTDFIFNKAVIETKFSVMYAKLAKELSGYCVKDADKVIYFRELLIGKCQAMFNDNISTDNENNVSKDLAVGCMIFIGELYNCGLMTNKIINSCLLLLLMKIDKNKSFLINCLTALTKTVGNLFAEKCPNETKLVFDKIEKLITSGTLQPKDRFAFMDLCDLKKAQGW